MLQQQRQQRIITRASVKKEKMCLAWCKRKLYDRKQAVSFVRLCERNIESIAIEALSNARKQLSSYIFRHALKLLTCCLINDWRIIAARRCRQRSVRSKYTGSQCHFKCWTERSSKILERKFCTLKWANTHSVSLFQMRQPYMFRFYTTISEFAFYEQWMYSTKKKQKKTGIESTVENTKW